MNYVPLMFHELPDMSDNFGKKASWKGWGVSTCNQHNSKQRRSHGQYKECRALLHGSRTATYKGTPGMRVCVCVCVCV